MTRLAALALTLALAGPVAAEEGYTVYPLADRWYIVTAAPVTLPPGGATRVTLPLDDIPGGLDSVPATHVHTVGHTGDDALTLSMVNFHPVAYGAYAPDVTLLLRNDSGVAQAYRIKVVVRGKE